MRKLLWVGVAVIVAVAGWYLGQKGANDQVVSPPTDGGSATASTPPDLTKAIEVSAALNEESKARALEAIAKLRAELAESPDLYSNWLELALQMKLVGAYDEAEAIWQYTATRLPTESVSYGNLANLYLYELQDADRAEAYYLKAIEVQPSLANLYYSAYEFYRYVRKDLVKAKQVLRDGIAANPANGEVLGPFLAEL